MKLVFAVFVLVVAASPWGLMILEQKSAMENPSDLKSKATEAAIVQANRLSTQAEIKIRELNDEIALLRTSKNYFEGEMNKLLANEVSVRGEGARLTGEISRLKGELEAALEAAASAIPPREVIDLELEIQDLKARIHAASEEIRRLNAVVNALSSE